MVLFLLPGRFPVYSQDDFDFGDSSDSAQAEKKDENPGVEKSKSTFSLRGSISAESSFQMDPFRWIRLGPALHLILDFPNNVINIYSEATGRINPAYYIEDDSKEVKDNYTAEVILRELYFQKSVSFLTITIGNKMIVWSESDILPVVDLVSAADMTESLFANPEEARLGQNIIGLDFFFTAFELNLVFSPYPLFNRITDNGHPYSLIPGAQINNDPENRTPEYAGRLKFTSGKIALSFAGGNVHNRLPLFSLNEDLVSLDPVYKTSFFTGIGGTLALDPFLLKLEARYSFKKPFQQTVVIPFCDANGCSDMTIPDGTYREDEMAYTLGFDFNAGKIGFFILEASIILPEMYFDSPENLSWLAALGWSKSLFRDQLDLSVFLIAADAIENIILRASAKWTIIDNLSVSAQYTGIWMNGSTGNSAESQYYESLEDFDRFDLIVRYHFALGKS